MVLCGGWLVVMSDLLVGLVELIGAHKEPDRQLDSIQGLTSVRLCRFLLGVPDLDPGVAVPPPRMRGASAPWRPTHLVSAASPLVIHSVLGGTRLPLASGGGWRGRVVLSPLPCTQDTRLVWPSASGLSEEILKLALELP